MQSEPTKGPILKPVTPEIRELFEEPSILSQLPLVFETGSVFDSFEGRCSVCNFPIAPQDLRGTITRPFSMVAVVEAIGACRRCEIYVPFYMRFKNDGRTETRDAAGNWVFGQADRKRAPSLSLKHAWPVGVALAIVGALVLR